MKRAGPIVRPSFHVQGRPTKSVILDPQQELAYWNEYADDGHFPAMEVPDVVVRELRAFFAGLR